LFYYCRDAEDAVAKRDGYDYDGYRLRVEFPRGGRSGGGGGGDRNRPRGGGRGGPARRSQYRVLVSGMELLKAQLLKHFFKRSKEKEEKKEFKERRKHLLLLGRDKVM